MSRLTDACDRLEERVRRFAPDVDVSGLAPATDEQIADAQAALAPLDIPEELREYWSRFGRAPLDIPTLRNGEHGETTRMWDVGTGVHHFGEHDPKWYLSGAPGPANLVPLAMVDLQLVLAEIDPGSSTCRIWNGYGVTAEAFLMLECIAEFVELLGDDLNVTELDRQEDSMWIGEASTPALHPEWFVAGTNRPSVNLDLGCRSGYPASSDTGYASALPWPDYWIPRPWPEDSGEQPDDWLGSQA